MIDQLCLARDGGAVRRENQHSGQNNCNLKQKVPGARQCPDAALRAPGGSGRRRGARSPEREMQAGAGQARGGGLGVHSEASEEPLKMSGAVTVSELPWQPRPQRAQGWREEVPLSSGACFCSHSPSSTFLGKAQSYVSPSQRHTLLLSVKNLFSLLLRARA